MSEKNILRDRIKRVLIKALELNLNVDDIEEKAQLDELSGFDSVAAIEFVLELEKEFGITIEPEDLDVEILKDLDRLATYIDRRISH
jgi:acyl carrier protein